MHLLFCGAPVMGYEAAVGNLDVPKCTSTFQPPRRPGGNTLHSVPQLFSRLKFRANVVYVCSLTKSQYDCESAHRAPGLGCSEPRISLRRARQAWNICLSDVQRCILPARQRPCRLWTDERHHSPGFIGRKRCSNRELVAIAQRQGASQSGQDGLWTL